MKETRKQLRLMDKVQAEYFGYSRLGLLGFIMPRMWIKAYLEDQFDQQPDGHKKGFEKWAMNHKRRREKMAQKVANECR